MPLYDYKCTCGKVQTFFRKYEERDEPPVGGCHGILTRIPSVPMIAGDYPGYESPTTGRWIEGRKAHIEDLKSSGCRVYEKGETEAYLKRLPEIRKEREKSVDAAVDAAARDIGLGS